MTLYKHWYLILLILTLLCPPVSAHAQDVSPPPATVSGIDTTSFSADKLFGHTSISSSDTTAFTKWHDVLERQAQIGSSPKVVKWLAFLDSIRGISPDAQMVAVNDYMNKVRYVSDRENYGVESYWASVEEFLTRGGNCVGYALAKYFSLIELGFPSDQMRLVILYDKAHNGYHAILAVTRNGKIDILDNQFNSIRDARSISTYKPIYAISQDQWWRYL